MLGFMRGLAQIRGELQQRAHFLFRVGIGERTAFGEVSCSDKLFSEMITGTRAVSGVVGCGDQFDEFSGIM